MGTEISRRTMLALTGAAAAATVLPSVPAHAVAKFTPAAVVEYPPLPAWAVGHGGDWDWQAIAAPDEDAARRIYVAEFMDYTVCGGDKPCTDRCDFCEAASGLNIDRKPTWDGKVGKLTGADWLRADMGYNCSRCGGETDLPSGMGHVVGDDAVCDDCMRLADWRIVDPEQAAEIEAEMIEDGLLPPPDRALAQPTRDEPEGRGGGAPGGASEGVGEGVGVGVRDADA